MSPTSVPVPVIAAAELRHELRTPLNHIIGYSEILLDEFPHAGIEANVEEIRREANEMLGEIHRVAGQEKTAIPESALKALGTSLEARIERVRVLASSIAAAVPDIAQPDVERIQRATSTLITVLSGVARSQASAVIPADSAARQPDPVAGRILVVDDNEPNRDMLQRQLERQQHHVATAHDGRTALEMLRADRFDIALLDLMMPGMNGLEVLAEIKGDAALSGVSVILISALDEMDTVVRSIEAGAEDYLFKPVNPTLLRARINGTLDKMRAREAVGRRQRLESIGLLAAGIAHDFNNLLTGIIGHAQLLEQVVETDEDRDMAQSIVSAGERAAELTRQLLAYSGKAMFQMQPVDLAGMLREAESLIAASLPKGARLRLNLSPVPRIVADKNQLLQAVLNLSINAGEAMGSDCSGTLSVETGAEKLEAAGQFEVTTEDSRPGWYAWIEVRDDGCGMDSATVAKMFEPFFSTKFLGRGLGLAAVAGIVRSHKGRLRVTTAPGAGTALRLYFPIAPGEEPVECSAEGPAVLVVDDEPVVRRIVKLALERAGRPVVLAESGEAAVQVLRALGQNIDLVLLDWKMPVMDGAETLARLREIRPDVRVIVSSGFALSDAEENFRDAGVTGYLQKPYRMSELVDLVNRHATACTGSP